MWYLTFHRRAEPSWRWPRATTWVQRARCPDRSSSASWVRTVCWALSGSERRYCETTRPRTAGCEAAELVRSGKDVETSAETAAGRPAPPAPLPSLRRRARSARRSSKRRWVAGEWHRQRVRRWFGRWRGKTPQCASRQYSCRSRIATTDRHDVGVVTHGLSVDQRTLSFKQSITRTSLLGGTWPPRSCTHSAISTTTQFAAMTYQPISLKYGMQITPE